MARMPGATQRPIPVNFTRGGQESVRGVAVHIMDGTLPGTDSWFRNPKAQASAHFGTGKAGELYQWVDTADRAWAQASGNRTWLSVENEGKGGDALTDAQLDRNAEVLAWAHRTEGVPLQVAASPSGYGLGFHAMGGDAWGGHTSCPGTRIVAQLPEIVERAKRLVAAPSSTEDSMPKYVNVGLAKGYTLKPGEWDSIEFTKEWTDEPGDHADGGSVFVRGAARFTGSLGLSLTGLPVGAVVQARMSEYEGDTHKADHPIHEITGTEGGTYAVVPLTKRLAAKRGMRVRLLNQGAAPVTVSSAVLSALIWEE
ncbi:N-acetylmuramoyl-L-alanine amidase [Streptomyces krungchingensis]|uniref:N-acetylmuramoyl-L-alanine amidase n=1 Tax=Streptomyces krungchingensis TaxID=1565034 RepID=UPI003CF14D34